MILKFMFFQHGLWCISLPDQSVEELEQKYYKLNTQVEEDRQNMFFNEIENKKNEYEKKMMDKMKLMIDDLTTRLEKSNMKYYEAEYKANLAEERKQSYGEVSVEIFSFS